MNKAQRQGAILAALRASKQPLTGSALAERFSVSRQIIVADIAALRRAGEPVRSTASGYALLSATATRVIACRHHTDDLLATELHTVVEYGGTVLDVAIDHPRYGKMRNELMIATHGDVAKFLRDMQSGRPICALTDGSHTHTIRARDEYTLDAITARLSELNILDDAQ